MTAVADRTDAPAGSARRGRRWLRRTVFGAVVVVALLLAYVLGTFVQIWWASRQDDAKPAQAIVVLGAAQYNGVPSPVLAARLDHAAELYKRGLAPLVVVTGGKQPGDLHTEAEAGALYLGEHGVPGDAIERETTSTNSYDEIAATARFLKARGISKVLLVSDPYHAFRIDAIADDVGLDALVSPTHTSPDDGFTVFKAMLRETAAVAIGRITGYDEADRLKDKLKGNG